MRFTITVVCCSALHGQESYENINSHFGSIASVPLHPMGTYTSVGWGLLGGAGYNFSEEHAAIGELIWTAHSATEQLFCRCSKRRGRTSEGTVSFMC
jgi:hypothetical protein